MFVGMSVDFGGVNFPKPYIEPDTMYVGFVAVFSGCKRAVEGHPCPDCQNPSLWAFDTPARMTISQIQSFVRKKAALFDSLTSTKKVQYYLTYLGGEPLDQDVFELAQVYVQFAYGLYGALGIRADTVVVFTGYPNLQSIPFMTRRFVSLFVDFLKVGSYLGNEYKQDGLASGLATPNQQWLDVRDM